MRKLIALLTILVSSFGFISAAAPAVASAANCTATEGSTYWNGVLNFQGILNGCSGVDQAEMYTASIAGFAVPSFSGWQDNTAGVDYQSTGPVDIKFGRAGVNLTGASWVFSHGAWCGGAAHLVRTQYQFRIHATGGAWGPWHMHISATYPILC